MTITFLTRFFRFLNRPVRTKRFEILLPLNYNDGRLIEPEKFDQTAEESCDRFGARDERSWKLRFHAQTAGCSLTWQQPRNNIVRTAIQALAAVLGGCQSLHTNSLDEAYALPSEQAATLALRTQQVIAYETGITQTPDPLGGSYYLEHLTCAVEQAANDYIRRIDEMGGMLPAIELSVRAISAPPRRPASWMRTPFAPASIV